MATADGRYADKIEKYIFILGVKYMTPPLITIYSRLKDNVTGEILTDWDEYDNSNWYYGYCLSNYGGESAYVVELDIWNNESNWNSSQNR